MKQVDMCKRDEERKEEESMRREAEGWMTMGKLFN